MHFRSLTVASAAAVLLIALTGCTGGSDGDATAPTATAKPNAEKLPNPKLVEVGPLGSPATDINADEFDPNTLAITAGEIVVFSSGDGSIHALSVNGQSDVTVANDLPALYKFENAGVYEAVDVVSGATISITVTKTP